MSATEDPWTNSTPTREYPIIMKYYSFYNAPDMIRNVHIKGGHNYNAETRAAVYEWFCTHLKSQFPPIKNPVPISPELKALGDLRVFPDGILPKNAVSGWDVIKNWKAASEKAFNEQLPRSSDQYSEFDITLRRKLTSVLAVEIPGPQDIVVQKGDTRVVGTITWQEYLIGRKGRGDCIEFESVASDTTTAGTVLVVYPESWGDFFFSGMENLKPWAAHLISKGYRVTRVRGYASGRLSIPQKTWDSFSWSSAYNRDNRLNGIQDIITAMQFCKSMGEKDRLTVVGLDSCGIPAAFACAVTGQADSVMIDLNGSDPGYDGELVKLMPYGAIRRVGDFRAAALLLMNRPLTLFNAGQTFDIDWYGRQAEAVGSGDHLTFRSSVTEDNFVDLF